MAAWRVNPTVTVTFTGPALTEDTQGNLTRMMDTANRMAKDMQEVIEANLSNYGWHMEIVMGADFRPEEN